MVYPLRINFIVAKRLLVSKKEEAEDATQEI